ncbi:hypothetical protein N7509_000305 [Penicillium cosmopolitanum]|uniref:Uncharacterized protein n=1 Tax=Penicillium cosmopolitanum TaxID=1131564 RepID=A0A9W9WAD5_9EURO|nr:uncharacterized protein N7509_000305 [Penicillium cosmopolitanum]KAJ5413678.1 hypothetical protein N7509_000305 [Penicillium cosmopolitanum]
MAIDNGRGSAMQPRGGESGTVFSGSPPKVAQIDETLSLGVRQEPGSAARFKAIFQGNLPVNPKDKHIRAVMYCFDDIFFWPEIIERGFKSRRKLAETRSEFLVKRHLRSSKKWRMLGNQIQQV